MSGVGRVMADGTGEDDTHAARVDKGSGGKGKLIVSLLFFASC